MSASKVAVVANLTGAVNHAVVRRLLRDGFHIVTHRVPEFQGSGDTITVVDDHAALAEAAGESNGRIDALILGCGEIPQIAWPPAEHRAVLTNAEGPLTEWLAAVEAALPSLERSGGRVVSVVSSVGRYRSGYFRPERDALSSTPAALASGAILALTRQLAFELAPRSIRLNAVVLGLLEGASDFELMNDEERRFVLEEISVGRPGTADEVAGAIAFLASDASNYLTGDALDVNGGWWMS